MEFLLLTWKRSNQFLTPVVALCAFIFLCGCMCGGEVAETTGNAFINILAVAIGLPSVVSVVAILWWALNTCTEFLLCTETGLRLTCTTGAMLYIEYTLRSWDYAEVVPFVALLEPGIRAGIRLRRYLVPT